MKESNLNKETKEKSEKKKKSVISEVGSFAFMVFLIFAFRSSFYEPFRIPTGSMIPTLMIGDFVLVNKFAYGLKVPYSDMIGDPIYITKQTHPQRGDVVVFRYPEDTSKDFVKRLIGLPGDEIQIIGKRVFINQKEVKEVEFDGSKIMADMDDNFKDYTYQFYKVKEENGIEHVVMKNVDSYRKSNWTGIVPPDSYFVLGDNRDHSADSRFWGFVPKTHMRGKAMFVWFSWIMPILDNNPTKLRLHRIGTKLN